MANIITFKRLRQIIRLYTENYSKRKISKNTGISRNTVSSYLRMFLEQPLTFEEINILSDYELDKLFGKESQAKPSNRVDELLAFFHYYSAEQINDGCTVEMMWEKYIINHPCDYQRTQFNFSSFLAFQPFLSIIFNCTLRGNLLQ